MYILSSIPGRNIPEVNCSLKQNESLFGFTNQGIIDVHIQLHVIIYIDISVIDLIRRDYNICWKGLELFIIEVSRPC